MALKQSTKQALRNQIPKAALVETRKTVQRAFFSLKTKMIAEFLGHPVTREIKGGINAKNISGTLGDITNLYSFIGFESGEDPIQPIQDLLEKTNLRFIKYNTQYIEFEVDLPDPNEIFAVTPLPWATGRSWAKGIETGLSGLGYYLKKSSSNSRSGLGLQTSKNVRKGVKFTNIKYISALIRKYQKEFENIKL
jgi:hypothetical protein